MDFRSVAFLSMLLLSAIGCCAGQKRALKPGNLYSLVGQDVSFITTIDPVTQQLLVISWTFNSGSGPVPIISYAPRGEDVSDAYKDRVVFNRTTGSLVLKAVTTSDSGDYSINMVTDYGVSIPGEVKLTVLAAFEDTKICYILDGILFLYGIIVTVLYFRMKMRPGSNLGHSQKKPEEGIYTGLTPHAQDTYETIRAQKKGMA